MGNSAPQRIIIGPAKCSSCHHTWFMVAPEIAEPPYQCPGCENNFGFCDPKWRFYGTLLEGEASSVIWVDGHSRRFEEKTLMEACIEVQKAAQALAAGDASLFESK